jgi:hypothetical protein
MNQLPLIRGEHLPSVYRYAELFKHLPSLAIVVSLLSAGRKPYDYNILLRALVYKCLRRFQPFQNWFLSWGTIAPWSIAWD